MNNSNCNSNSNYTNNNKTDKTSEQAEMLYNRVVKRQRHLRKWARRTGTDAYRLYDRDIPEIPVVLDIYGDAVSGALYKRPYEKDEAEENDWLAAMSDAVSKSLDIRQDRIFIKTRQKQKGASQYNRMGKSNFWIDINEGALKFRVNLSDYLDTGIFPDARKKRSLLMSEAAGKSVLNLFAYTCTLSLAAARGGASRVDSVDMSNTYLDWGEVNFALNGFSGQNGYIHNTIRSDVFPFLDRAAADRKKWDIIILDPPSFSNSKKMSGHLDIHRDYRKLIYDCLAILEKNGCIWFSTNARGFKLDQNDLRQMQIEDITEKLRDEDFKGKRIPSRWVIKKSPSS